MGQASSSPADPQMARGAPELDNSKRGESRAGPMGRYRRPGTSSTGRPLVTI